LATPPGAPDALLIVEALGWHVRLQDRLERANIDADFHGSGHCEQIDLAANSIESIHYWTKNGLPLFGVILDTFPRRDKDPTELALPLSRIRRLSR
jgi:hypothetical protein